MPSPPKPANAECLDASATPIASPQPMAHGQRQVVASSPAHNAAMASDRASGRSVITTGRCAPTVGSSARNSKVPQAQARSNARHSSRPRTTSINPCSVHNASRARVCAARASLPKNIVVSTQSRSCDFSCRSGIGGSLNVSGIHAPTHNFTSGGCSGLRWKPSPRT